MQTGHRLNWQSFYKQEPGGVVLHLEFSSPLEHLLGTRYGGRVTGYLPSILEGG